MSVKVNIPPILQRVANEKSQVTIDGSTVEECLNQFINQFPDSKELLFDEYGKLHECIQLFINEASIYPEILSKSIKDGDILDILFVITGG